MDTITIVVENGKSVRSVIATDGIEPEDGFNICMAVAHQMFHPQMVKIEAQKLREEENAELAKEPVPEGDSPSGDEPS